MGTTSAVFLLRDGRVSPFLLHFSLQNLDKVFAVLEAESVTTGLKRWRLLAKGCFTLLFHVSTLRNVAFFQRSISSDWGCHTRKNEGISSNQAVLRDWRCQKVGHRACMPWPLIRSCYGSLLCVDSGLDAVFEAFRLVASLL
jgi:hypothetical protein